MMLADEAAAAAAAAASAAAAGVLLHLDSLGNSASGYLRQMMVFSMAV